VGKVFRFIELLATFYFFCGLLS
jgi:hypothetical protein